MFTLSFCEGRVRRQVGSQFESPVWSRDPALSNLESFFNRPENSWMNPFINRPAEDLQDTPGSSWMNPFNNRPAEVLQDNIPTELPRGRANNRRRTTTEAPPSVPRTIHLSPSGCPCPITPQFNPVCGSDGNTYKNSGLLNCYRQCGTSKYSSIPKLFTSLQAPRLKAYHYPLLFMYVFFSRVDGTSQIVFYLLGNALLLLHKKFL